MIAELFQNPLFFVLSFAALTIAVTVHEFAHAFTADRLGDPTPSLQGRVTLNPLAHLDPIGTIMLLFFRFGWGKPVQFDPFNLKNPKRDAAIISLAGPASNMITATGASVVLRLFLGTGSGLAAQLGYAHVLISLFLIVLIQINVVLAIFNLIPIHPLDGFKIVGGFLPEEYQDQWYMMERYGMWILVFLLFFPFFGSSPIHTFITPIINFFTNIFIPQTPLV